MGKSPKFKKNQVLYYPGADIRKPHLVEAKVTAIIDDVDGSFYYMTEGSYRIPESEVFTTPAKAKERLIEKIEESDKRSAEAHSKVKKQAEKDSAKKLVKYGKEVQKQHAQEHMMI